MSASARPAAATSAPSASTAASTASALGTQCSPRCEMVKVSSRSSKAALIRLPPRSRDHGMDRVDVGIAAAEGDDLPGMTPSGFHQPVAMGRVVGDDGDALGLEAGENLRLGIGDRVFRPEILDVGGGNRGDERDVGPDRRGQGRDLAGIVHAHFEDRIVGIARHPRQAQRNPGMVVVALDRTVDPAGTEAVERGV